MNIALVILHADPSRGGAERYTIDLATALLQRGHQVSLISTSFAGESVGSRVLLAANSVTRLGTYIKFLDALDDHLASHAYDIIHAMLPVRHCDVYHPHAGLAVDAVAHGHEKHDGLRRNIAGVANRLNRKRNRFAQVERELLGGARPPVVLCLSEYVKRTVLQNYALPDHRLATLFNAVDLQQYDPAARSEAAAGAEVRRRYRLTPDRVVALMIAQDFQRKGLAEAINAMSGHDARLSLLVVGKQNPAAYEALARQRGVGGRVIFAGPTSDPYLFYRAADFFVLPTRHDPCSLVVLESLAMGVPVISTRFNGACEIMAGGVHGFILQDPRDVAELSRCYTRMMDDIARQNMSAACLELRPCLSQEEHLNHLVAIYQSPNASTNDPRNLK